MFVRNGVVLGSVLADPSTHRSTKDLVMPEGFVADEDQNDAPETEPASATDLDDARHDDNVVSEQPPADDAPPPAPEPQDKPAPAKAPAKKAPAKAAFKSALDAQKG